MESRTSSRVAAVKHLDRGINVAGGLNASNGNSTKARYFLPEGLTRKAVLQRGRWLDEGVVGIAREEWEGRR